MDAELVEKFCDITAQLIVPLGTYAGTEVAQRDPVDTELVRQLHVAAGAINEALSQVARLTPPALPPMRPPPAPIGSTPPASEPGPERERETEAA
jgi:hypothetical protein